MRHTTPDSRTRLIRFVLCLSLLAHVQLPAKVAASAARGPSSSTSAAGSVAVRQDTAAAGLPDLDEARKRPRHEPKAVPPVPSTHRRCPPRNRHCNPDDGGQPHPSPTPASAPSHGGPGRDSNSLASLTSGSLLALMSVELGGGRPLFDVPLLDYLKGERGHSVSDSPPRVGIPPASAYEAAPEPAAYFQSQQGRVNYALSSGGATATAQSYTADGVFQGLHFQPLYANDGVRYATTQGDHYWRDEHGLPTWIQVDFGGVRGIDEVDLYTLADYPAYVTQADPPATQTFTQYGVTAFDVQYWTGSAWAAVQGGSVSGNNLVWKRLTFTTVATSKLRVAINSTADGVARLTEVEAWGPLQTRTNVALASNGGTATAQNYTADGVFAGLHFQPTYVNDGVRYATPQGDRYWRDEHGLPSWVQVDFNGQKVIDEVDVYTLADYPAYTTQADPPATQTFTQYGVTAFEVKYWTGSSWATVQGGSVSGNNLVWRKLSFQAVTTDRLRVVVNAAADGVARITEVEAWGTVPPGNGLTAEYFDNDDFTGYSMTRSDAAVDFDWGGGAPSPSMGADFFSVRWAGMVVPRYSETYTFHTTTDDGVRLWVDGQLLIDKWVEQAPTEWTGAVTLQAGRAYTVRMEFFEHWGGARAKLQWSSPSQAKEVIPPTQLYGCWKDAGRFTRDLFQGALSRQPNPAELQDWANRLAQAQGEAQLVAEAQSLGESAFTSAEYTARNRADGEYVSDLYWAYMQRAPDQSGWAAWTSQITQCGADQQCRAAQRSAVRAAFGQSGEFQEKVRNLCGTAASAAANGGAGYNFSTARLDPANRTGGDGVDPYSRNFNWSVPLVSLPGRAGLDLGLTLSYNSLVWTKDAGGVTYDADEGFPSPGFRLGFPTIQPKFFNPLTQKFAYLLVTPSGARVELRQTATPGVYESADSSYLQLLEGGGALTLLSTVGTRLSFALLGGSYRCREVRDRNGNYVSAGYHADGRLDRVVDTLGRTLTFNYDTYQNLVSITQPWRRETEAQPTPTQDEQHTWATFGYGDPLTLLPSFSNLAIIGDQPGASIPVLRQVGLSDGSYYRFEYNGWGQVWKVTHFAADAVGANGQPNFSHALSSTRLDLPGSDLAAAAPQPDCPRFTQERTWVEHGVLNQSAEVATTYSPWTPNMASCEVLAPDGKVKSVESYATAGWRRGLTTQSEVWAVNETTQAWEQKKTTAVEIEHDGAPDATLPTNPRVAQTTVSDPQGNGRTTRVEYTTPADFQGESGYAGTLNLRLPKKVEECDAGCASVLRTTVTDYKVSHLGEYVSRRILGLARFRYLYEGAAVEGNLRAQTGYVYDELNVEGDPFLAALQTPAAQHYGLEYGQVPNANGQGGLRWRGNANRVRRYSVDQQSGAVGGYVESRAGFNVTGTPAYAKDAEGHKTSLSYADAFYLNVNRTHLDPQYRLKTFAYPTAVTDPDGYTANASYNYDMGMVTKTRTPAPNVTQAAGQPTGPEMTRFYDAAGRLLKSANSLNGAHTELVYDPSMKFVATLTTVSDSSLLNPAERLYEVTAFDGLGRARGSARDFFGSTGESPVGNYAAQIINYDQMGRTVFRSNLTEMRILNGAWTPAGDDANGGVWKGTSYVYDWKGRPRKVINADGSNRLFEYGGCGCAGGEVVTEQEESVPIPGSSTLGRRTSRVYHDALGRAWKTETLNWGGSVYASTTTQHNAFDQPLRVRQYEGPAPTQEPSGEGNGYQTTTMTYDGHGQLKTRRLPQYDPGASDSYTYFADDTLETETDPRGMKTELTYDGRHHVKTVARKLPGGALVESLSVTFDYDAAGNRTKMADGTGTTGYHYDAFSRMDWEKRQFAGLAGEHQLSYQYNPGGALTRLDYPSGAYVTYHYDPANALLTVKGWGAGFTNGQALASDIKHRAWGGLKEINYADGASVVMSYDERLRLTRRDVTGVTYTGMNPGSGPSGATYSYYADGRLRYAQDIQDGKFDRAYSYDHAGRLKEALTGQEARGGAQTFDRPYRQTFGYDVWGNLNSRGGYHWTAQQTDTAQYSYNRRQGWTYDAAGRTTVDTWEHTYDAAGQKTKSQKQSLQAAPSRGPDAFDTEDVKIEQAYDGAGASVSRVVTTRHGDETGDDPAEVETERTVRSTVLGGVAAYEMDDTGSVLKVYAEGAELARLTQGVVEYRRSDPLTGAWVQTGRRREPDPLGAEAGEWNPYVSSEPPYDPLDPTGAGAFKEMGDLGDIRGSCVLDSMPVPCSIAMGEVNSGTALIDRRGTDMLSLINRGVSFIRDYSNEPQGYLDWGLDGDGRGRWIQPYVEFLAGRFEFIGGISPLRDVFTGAPNVELIGNNIKEMLNDPTCGDYVEALYSKVESENPRNTRNSTSIWDLFGKVTSTGQGGIVRRHPLTVGGKPAQGTVSGSLQTNDATIIIAGVALQGGLATAPEEERMREVSINDAMTVLHELFHLAGSNYGYSDQQLALAASKLPGASTDLPEAGSKDAFEWSKYWDQELSKHCKPQRR